MGGVPRPVTVHFYCVGTRISRQVRQAVFAADGGRSTLIVVAPAASCSALPLAVAVKPVAMSTWMVAEAGMAGEHVSSIFAGCASLRVHGVLLPFTVTVTGSGETASYASDMDKMSLGNRLSSYDAHAATARRVGELPTRKWVSSVPSARVIESAGPSGSPPEKW